MLSGGGFKRAAREEEEEEEWTVPTSDLLDLLRVRVPEAKGGRESSGKTFGGDPKWPSGTGSPPKEGTGSPPKE